MILLAESGSTKTDWVSIGKTGVEHRQQSHGINPFHQNADAITENLKSLNGFEAIDQIFFYGAGCANAEKKQIVADALQMVYPEAVICINSDLLAAARSLCGKQKGIACIMGTGSNSCLYDGEKIISNISPLGYILGDEGSGAVLGKKLVSDILKNQAPEEISNLFFEKYSTTAAEMVNSVYRKEFPSRFLAQFTVFLKENIGNKYVKDLVTGSFTEFFDRNIMQYDHCLEHIHFTGSIAYYFQKELKVAAEKSGFSLGNILKSPLEGLIQFHTEKQ